MKKFMMIFMGAPYEELGLSPEQMQERMGKWFAWTNKMAEAGILESGEALHGKARRVSGPDRTVSDGPFVEGKELIGGYYVIKANSADEVVEVAADFPDYDLNGTVEIREVMDYK